MQAFILAAGKGQRLYPFSKILPKPLFPILGKPILNIILDQLISSGFKKIGINTFYLKDKIINFVKHYQKKCSEIEIRIFEEPKLLGTGGAILNAKDFFKKPTLIINSDILTNLNFKALFFKHLSISYPITMVFFKGKNNNVVIDTNSFDVLAFRTNSNKNTHSLFTYAGIQIINPDILPFFSSKNDLIEIYHDLLKNSIKIHAYIPKNSYFKDIGTISDYLNSHEDILINKIKIPFVPLFKDSIIIKQAQIEENVSFKDWVFIEDKTFIEKNTILSKVISWKGAYIKTGIYKNCILI